MDFLSRKGNGRGTLILIHGNSSSPEIFRPIMESGYLPLDCIAVSLPGHQGAPWGQTNFGDIVADLATLVTKSISPVFVLGHSLGGHLAIELLAQETDIAGLIISGTPPLRKPYDFEAGFLALAEAAVYFTPNPDVLLVESLGQKMTKDQDLAVRIGTDFHRTDPMFRLALTQSFERGFWSDQYRLFTQTPCPKLVIQGKQDVIVNKEYVNEACNQAIGYCKMHAVKGAGHFAIAEESDLIGGLLNDFISSVI